MNTKVVRKSSRYCESEPIYDLQKEKQLQVDEIELLIRVSCGAAS